MNDIEGVSNERRVMAASSPIIPERSRKMVSIVLQALSDPGSQADIAQQLGLSESTVSRLKNEHLEPLCGMLALAGLKIVPADVHCYRPEQIHALLVLAKQHLAQVDSVEQLRWE